MIIVTSEERTEMKKRRNIFVLLRMFDIVVRVGFHVSTQSVPEQRQLSIQLSAGQI